MKKFTVYESNFEDMKKSAVKAAEIAQRLYDEGIITDDEFMVLTGNGHWLNAIERNQY